MLSKKKVRLTELLVSRGLCESEAEAKRIVLAGDVLGDDICLTQPNAPVDPELKVRIKAHGRYVSRGGDKLAGALADFSLNPAGLSCLDVGASTGGFTDCLLQQGAAQVVAIDVAYGQFAWQLRGDERVRLFERTNIRSIDPDSAGAPFDLVVADLSFVSLNSILSVLVPFLADKALLICLVKPQFELLPTQVGKGIVTSQAAHIQALDRVIEAASACGLAPLAATFSRIVGHKGNIEFFLLTQQGGIPATIDTKAVVKRAHEALA
jgi:23S rRNA (cytidine1920-2'-O)/16S rRNA (cytidine1409-2'-O)-methyltransferase